MAWIQYLNLGYKYGIRTSFNTKKNIENVAKEKNISESKLIENAIIEYLKYYYDYKIILKAEERLKKRWRIIFYWWSKKRFKYKMKVSITKTAKKSLEKLDNTIQKRI